MVVSQCVICKRNVVVLPCSSSYFLLKMFSFYIFHALLTSFKRINVQTSYHFQLIELSLQTHCFFFFQFNCAHTIYRQSNTVFMCLCALMCSIKKQVVNCKLYWLTICVHTCMYIAIIIVRVNCNLFLLAMTLLVLYYTDY